MIFVTVGTHEQPFNRLIQKIDELVRDGESKTMYSCKLGTQLMNPNILNGKSLLDMRLWKDV